MEGKMTKAADVYSFGMLMWEVVTGKKLFEGLRQSQVRPHLTQNTHHVKLLISSYSVYNQEELQMIASKALHAHV